jgi:AraC-like DNA-binding protein
VEISYAEWHPSEALAGVVTAYWSVIGDGSRVASPAILADGHIELVMNLGESVRLDGPAFTGDQPARVVVGPLSHAVRMHYGRRVETFGIRLHPAVGSAFLSRRASDLTDTICPLADVCPALDVSLREALEAHRDPTTEAGRAAIGAALARHLSSCAPRDDIVVEIVDRLTRSADLPTVASIAVALAISPRQLQPRLLAAVGMTPKRFVRVIRFSRVWQAATMHPVEAWAALAVEHGYADQAHMVREFRAFGAEPPTQQFAPDWYPATSVTRVTGPSQGVRSVQDPPPAERK